MDPERTAVAADGPVRTCVGCRTRRPSHELVRLTRRASSTRHAAGVVVDGPSDGRGAWICRDSASECIELAVRRRAFDRAWRAAVGADEHDDIRRALARVDTRVTTSAADGAADHTTDAPGVTVGTTTGKG